MSTTSEGSGCGSEEEPVAQTGRPPVPGRVTEDGGATGVQADAGHHRTERVPFPLPGPAAAPPTGRLQLGGYPPRVPGATRRPGPDPRDGDLDAAGGDDTPGRQ